jgi:hypothetical protein
MRTVQWHVTQRLFCSRKPSVGRRDNNAALDTHRRRVNNSAFGCSDGETRRSEMQQTPANDAGCATYIRRLLECVSEFKRWRKTLFSLSANDAAARGRHDTR